MTWVIYLGQGRGTARLWTVRARGAAALHGEACRRKPFGARLCWFASANRSGSFCEASAIQREARLGAVGLCSEFAMANCGRRGGVTPESAF